MLAGRACYRRARKRGNSEDYRAEEKRRKLTIAPASPLFFVSVDSKQLKINATLLESTLAGAHVGVDSKGSYRDVFGDRSRALILISYCLAAGD